MKPRIIKREEFEEAGFRIIELAHGEVQFKDGTTCNFNVWLSANGGPGGDVNVTVEDINKPMDRASKRIKLKRSKL